MELEALISQLPALEAEAAECRRQEQEAAARAEHLERIIEGIRGLTSTRADQRFSLFEAEAPMAENDGASLRGIAAVRRVMLEHPDRVWKARDVHTQLEQRGWVSPDAQHPLRGTEAAINRLWKRGELDKVRTGRYRVTDQMSGMVDED
jgi:hypothetical protein